MRYLTQSKRHFWTFRYQIPKRFRPYFQHQCEFKRTLGNISVREARLKALALENMLLDSLGRIEDVEQGEESRHPPRALFCRLKAESEVAVLRILDIKQRLQLKPRSLRFLQNYVLNEETYSESINPSLLRGFQAIYLEGVEPSVSALSQVAQLECDCPTLTKEIRGKALSYLKRFFGLLSQACLALIFSNSESLAQIIQRIRSNHFEADQEETISSCEQIGLEQLSTVEKVTQPRSNESKISASKSVQKSKASITNINEELTNHDIAWYCEQYKREKTNQLKNKMNAHGQAREAERTVSMCLLVHELIGKNDIYAISRSDANTALESLRQFPKVSGSKINKARFHAYPKSQWVRINESANLDVLSEGTVGRYIEKSSTIYKWIRENYLPSILNPFCGLASKSNLPNQKQEDDVNSFSRQDLSKIFSQAVFTELKIKKHKTKNIIQYSQYWMPLIALLSGLRPNEIAQLKRKNIKFEDDIWYMSLSDLDSDQSLKNKGARRAVPIHSKLLDLGFENYFESFSSEERLFPELSYSQKSGYYGAFGDWFKRYFSKVIDLSSGHKRFYSFRHTVIDVFKQSGEVAAVPASLVGHKNGNITYDRYGSQANLRALKQYIERIDFANELSRVTPFQWLS
ncbi:site-specific integrase [Vibrio sp. WXL210]|uniref:site-specific integrase n=1 Tax=Vibrio sp. WXL210 TaxID=3450709 RepID=UPI003EC80846